VAISRADGSFAAQHKQLAQEVAEIEVQLGAKKMQRDEVVAKRVKEAMVRFGAEVAAEAAAASSSIPGTGRAGTIHRG
jgi:hypothetical protein